jgi:hypothetical protein
MSPEELSEWLRREPYIPLRIHVTDRIHYDIVNPNFAMVGKSVIFIGLRRDIDSPLFDEPVMVSLRHITRVEPILEPSTPNSTTA